MGMYGNFETHVYSGVYIYQLREKEKQMLVYVQKKAMGVGTQPADVPVFPGRDLMEVLWQRQANCTILGTRANVPKLSFAPDLGLEC